MILGHDDSGKPITTEPVFIPSMISTEHMPLLFKDTPDSVKLIGKGLLNDGWKIFAVRQNRGRCYYRKKVITIPTWAILRSTSYKTWYICHEMSHALDWIRHGSSDNHGQRFMSILMEICPPADVVHEIGYKPRNAKKAGILDLGME